MGDGAAKGGVMRVCLMIEGQENVTWDQWKAIAKACEDSGIDTLFRSDHYLSVEGEHDRGSLDAWTQIAALGAITEQAPLRHAGLAGDLPASVGAGQGRGHRRPRDRRRPGRARPRRRLARGRARGLRVPVPAHRHADGDARRAARAGAALVGGGTVQLRGQALHRARPRRPAQAARAPAPLARRPRRPAQPGAGRALRGRVQHLPHEPRRVPRGARGARRRVREGRTATRRACRCR